MNKRSAIVCESKKGDAPADQSRSAGAWRQGRVRLRPPPLGLLLLSLTRPVATAPARRHAVVDHPPPACQPCRRLCPERRRGLVQQPRDGGNELIGQPTSDEMDETSPVLLRQVTKGDGREA